MFSLDLYLICHSLSQFILAECFLFFLPLLVDKSFHSFFRKIYILVFLCLVMMEKNVEMVFEWIWIYFERDKSVISIVDFSFFFVTVKISLWLIFYSELSRFKLQLSESVALLGLNYKVSSVTETLVSPMYLLVCLIDSSGSREIEVYVYHMP